MSTAYTTSNQGLETRGSVKREETVASKIRTDHASEDMNMDSHEELRHPTEAQRPKKRRYGDIEPITNVWVDYKGERWVEGWAEKAAKQMPVRESTKSSWQKAGKAQGKGTVENPYIEWVPQPAWADPENFIYIGEDNVLEQIAAHESIVRQVCRHIKCASAVIRKELHTTALKGSVISRDKPHLTVEFGLTKERADWNAHLEVSFHEVEPQNIQGKRKPKPVMLQGDKPYMPIERIKNIIPTSLLGLENISDVLHRVREELRPIKQLKKRKTRPSDVDMTDNQPQLKQPVWIDFDFQIDNYGLNLDYRTMYDDIFIPKTLHIHEPRSKSTSPSHKPAQGASSSRAPKSKWDEDRYYRYSYQEHDRTLKSRSKDRRRPFNNSGLRDERNRSRHHGSFQPRSSVALGRGDYYRPGGDLMHDTYVPNYSHHELPIRKRSRLDDRR